MKILVTSGRAPVALEWARLLIEQGHEVLVSDSLRYPITAFFKQQTGSLTYHRVPSPRFDWLGYKAAMTELIERVDLVIPTCEDSFYLARLPLEVSQRSKLFLADSELLLTLHHKQAVFSVLPIGTEIRYPETTLVTDVADLDLSRLGTSIVKPVYSRFGGSVFLEPSLETVTQLEMSKTYPWVQQERLAGRSFCSYALCQHGRIVCQVVYEAKYRLKASASTYFEAVDEPRITDFVCQFVQEHHFHGQLSFDFIATEEGIYVIECNPRATSGLHILAPQIRLTEQGFSQDTSKNQQVASLGKLLYSLFGLSYLKSGDWLQLTTDLKRSQSVFAGVRWPDMVLSWGELFVVALKNGLSLTGASTFDMEYNGELEEK